MKSIEFAVLWNELGIEGPMNAAAQRACYGDHLDAGTIVSEVQQGLTKAVRPDLNVCDIRNIAWDIYWKKVKSYWRKKQVETKRREKLQRLSEKGQTELERAVSRANRRVLASPEDCYEEALNNLMKNPHDSKLLTHFLEFRELDLFMIPWRGDAKSRRAFSRLMFSLCPSQKAESRIDRMDRRDFIWQCVLGTGFLRLDLGGDAETQCPRLDVQPVLRQFAQMRRDQASPQECLAVIIPQLRQFLLRTKWSVAEARAAFELIEPALVIALDQMHATFTRGLLKIVTERVLPALDDEKERMRCAWRMQLTRSRFAYHRHWDRVAIDCCRLVVGDDPRRFREESKGVLSLDDQATAVFEMGNRIGRLGHVSKARDWFDLAKELFEEKGTPELVSRVHSYQAFSTFEKRPDNYKARQALEAIEATPEGQNKLLKIQRGLPLLAARLASNRDVDDLMAHFRSWLRGTGYVQGGDRLVDTVHHFALPLGLKGKLERQAREIRQLLVAEEFGTLLTQKNVPFRAHANP